MEIRGQDPTLYDALETAAIERRTFLRSVLAVSVLALAGCEREAKPDIFTQSPTWQQNFRTMPDGGLDTNIWRAKLGPERGGGQQVYTDHPENIAVRGGALVITALEQQIENHPFSSARIDTLGHKDFGYGKLVVRAKLPRGVGPHSAIWMRRVPHGNDASGEIDVLEHVGKNGTRVYTNLHTGQSVATNSNGLVTDHTGYDVPTAHDDFNDYGVERTPEGIIFTINGHQVGQRISPSSGQPNDQEWPFGADDRYYLILNIAVGDDWGGQNGVDTNSDPWQMEVEDISFYDYVGATT